MVMEEEGTTCTFRALEEVVSEHGLFCSLYADRGAHYWHMVLSRFGSGYLIAILAIKETDYGTTIWRGIQTGSGSPCFDQRADAEADFGRFGYGLFDLEQMGRAKSA